MKNTFVSTSCSVTIVAILASCASGPPSYEQNIQSAISGSGNVSVQHLEDGIVLLTGWVEDSYTRMAVQRAAEDNKREIQVINRIQVPWKSDRHN